MLLLTSYNIRKLLAMSHAIDKSKSPLHLIVLFVCFFFIISSFRVSLPQWLWQQPMPLFPTPRFLSNSTFKNCSLKWRWIAVDVYWAAKYEHSLSATPPDLLHVGFLLSHTTPPPPRPSFPSHLSTTPSHFIPWGIVAVEVECTIEIYYLSSQDNNWDVFGNQH